MQITHCPYIRMSRNEWKTVIVVIGEVLVLPMKNAALIEARRPCAYIEIILYAFPIITWEKRLINSHEEHSECVYTRRSLAFAGLPHDWAPSSRRATERDRSFEHLKHRRASMYTSKMVQSSCTEWLCLNSYWRALIRLGMLITGQYSQYRTTEYRLSLSAYAGSPLWSTGWRRRTCTRSRSRPRAGGASRSRAGSARRGRTSGPPARASRSTTPASRSLSCAPRWSCASAAAGTPGRCATGTSGTTRREASGSAPTASTPADSSPEWIVTKYSINRSN